MMPCNVDRKGEPNMRKFLVTVTLVIAMSLGIVASPVFAAPTGASDAAAFCQELNAEGFLLEELGITVGECVNLVKGPVNENSNNFVAAICGVDFIQEDVGTTTKGQCIKVVRTIFSS